MLAIFVKFDVYPDYRETLIEALIQDGQGSIRDEPNTLRFDIIQDSSNSNIVFLYEVYRDEASFEDHTKGTHYNRAMQIFNEMVASNNGTIEELVRGVNIFPSDKDRSWQRNGE